MGRKPLGDVAMTEAERQRRHRARHKRATTTTAHRDLYLLAVHTSRLIRLLKVAQKKYGGLVKDDGVPLPIKLEMNKLTDETKIINIAGQTVGASNNLYWTQPGRSIFVTLTTTLP